MVHLVKRVDSRFLIGGADTRGLSRSGTERFPLLPRASSSSPAAFTARALKMIVYHVSTGSLSAYVDHSLLELFLHTACTGGGEV